MFVLEHDERGAIAEWNAPHALRVRDDQREALLFVVTLEHEALVTPLNVDVNGMRSRYRPFAAEVLAHPSRRPHLCAGLCNHVATGEAQRSDGSRHVSFF